jgi:hypothetical protein
MKRILLFCLLLVSFNSFSQIAVYRSTSGVTSMDSRMGAYLNMFLPRYIDTTAANVQKGIDSCGAIIFTYTGNTVWKRSCNPKKWEEVGGSSTSTNIYNTNGTLTGARTVTQGTNILTFNSTYSNANDAGFKIVGSGANSLALGITSNLRGMTINAPAPLYLAGSGGNYGIEMNGDGVGILMKRTATSTNSVITTFESVRATTGTPANGIGQAFDFLNHAGDGNNWITNRIISKLANVNAGASTLTSQFEIWGRINNVLTQEFTITASGQLQGNTYGIGTHTGTEAYSLGVTSSGAIIESPSYDMGVAFPTSLPYTVETGIGYVNVTTSGTLTLPSAASNNKRTIIVQNHWTSAIGITPSPEYNAAGSLATTQGANSTVAYTSNGTVWKKTNISYSELIGDAGAATGVSLVAGSISANSSIGTKTNALRKLKAGTNITLTADANNDIIIDAAAGGGTTETASNLSTGIGVFNAKVVDDLQFKSFDRSYFDDMAGPQITISSSFLGTVNSTKTGSLLNVRFLTSGTSYTPTSGTTKIVFEAIGAGGGGGGASGAASSVGAGAGGGAGAIVKGYATVSSSTTYTYAIGAAGTAGANTGGTGGTGGNTTLTIDATTYTAGGGTGGTGQTTGTSLAVTLGGAAGTGTNGDVNGGGQNGDNGVRLSGTVGISGAGGTSFYGKGGAALAAAAAGNAATGYGAGGGGALSTANTNRAGGAGAPGILIIYEYK